jgi:ATP-dependent Clp protease ATP-binding subunit ClpC
MDAKFSPRVREVISLSREEALRLGHNYIGVEHLLLGIIKEGEGTAVRILEGLNCDLQKLGNWWRVLCGPPPQTWRDFRQHSTCQASRENFENHLPRAKIFKSAIIGTEHLLLSILKDEDNVATKSIHAFNIDYDVAKEEFENLLSDGNTATGPRADHPMSDGDAPMEGAGDGGSGGSGGGPMGRKGDPKSKTPVLDNFGRDLTKMAEEGKLDPSSAVRRKLNASAKC